jgi:CheY-like chemotaxis protein
MNNFILPSASSPRSLQHYSPVIGEEDPPLVVAAAASAPISSPPLNPRPPMHILVVDDVKSIRRVLERALSHQGHMCHVASDGEECVEMIQKESEKTTSREEPSSSSSRKCFYDLLLIDSEMPVMCGPTATKMIRSLGFDDLIIFGVTGNVLPEDVEMFLDHGVDAVLGKPMNLETMWREYDRIAREKRLSNESGLL